MIDLHCHLLPGIDDGAKTLADSLEMARVAVGNGITYAVMTPHLHPGRYENTRSSTVQPVREFRAALRSEQIALEISVAAEVRLSPEILVLLEQDELPFLGDMDGYRILLLEFPHTHIPLGANNLAKRLLDNKIRPIIAHPERNKDVIRDLAKIEPFIEMGCLLQLTASAVAGRFGAGPHRCARKLLELGVVTVLATDAHNLRGRQPELREGMEAAAEIVGEEAAYTLVDANPRAIVGPDYVRSQ
jgi:protein-tyrosine phosphatase